MTEGGKGASSRRKAQGLFWCDAINHRIFVVFCDGRSQTNQVRHPPPLCIQTQVIVLQSTWKSGNFRDALQYLRPNPFYMGIVRMLLEQQKVREISGAFRPLRSTECQIGYCCSVVRNLVRDMSLRWLSLLWVLLWLWLLWRLSVYI